MGKSKGTTFVSLKSFVLKRFGSEGWTQLLNSLDPLERVFVERPLTSKWYDFELVYKAEQALVHALGKGDLKVAREFGHFGAEKDLTFLEIFFLKMANPAYAIEKAGQYWHRFHDWGEVKVERMGKCNARVTIKGCPHPNEPFCEELTGYIERLFQLVGAKEVFLEHKHCRARKAEECVWEGHWKG
jgi:hypothetical protein